MRAGQLDKPIEIYQPNVTVDEFGHQSTDYVKIYETRANVSHKTGSREAVNDEVIYVYSKTFKVRSYVPVGDFCWIKYNGKFWRILQIEPDKRMQQLTIETELVNE